MHTMIASERTILSSWAFARVGETLILCAQGEHEPPEADFVAWLERMAVRDYKTILVHSRGGDLTAKQRRRLAAFWNHAAPPVPRTALLTDSLATRAILTALQWLMNAKDTKAFPLSEIDGAVSWLHERTSSALLAEEIAGMHAALRMQDRPSVRVRRATREK